MLKERLATEELIIWKREAEAIQVWVGDIILSYEHSFSWPRMTA